MNGSLSAGADASGLAGPEIEVLGLAKTYAGGAEAVRGIDFQVGRSPGRRRLGALATLTQEDQMRLDSLFYRLAYRFGRPRWDTTEPRPELAGLLQGRRPGRALDLGCGTGTDAIYLAGQGWEVTGVDFVPEAIETARTRARAAGSTASFVAGDVTRLRQAGASGPFDLMMDIGCYHAIPAGLRDAYTAEVAAVARPGADFYLAGITDPPATWRLLGARGVSAAELHRRLGADFDLADERTAGPAGRVSHFVLYHLVRKQATPSD